MKRKYLFCSLLLIFVLIALGLLFFTRHKSVADEIKPSFSIVGANSTNFIDIQKIATSDFKNIVKGKYGGIFVLKNNSQKQIYFADKKIQDFALSPSLQQVVFSYDPNENDELREYELILMVFDLTSKNTKKIFHTTNPSWDVRSDIYWLGENHVVFIRNCGTSCQGVTLFNVSTGETKNATLSYMLSSDRPAYTHFEDWFGNHHEVNDFVERVYTATVKGKHYLLFDMKTETGEESHQEKFLFAGDSLILES